jgi:hypothetical protein
MREDAARHVERAAEVDAPGQIRIGAGLGRRGDAGEVEDMGRLEPVDQGRGGGGIGDVEGSERTPPLTLDVADAAGGENRQAVWLRGVQRRHGVAADKTGSPGDQHAPWCRPAFAHRSNPLLRQT